MGLRKSSWIDMILVTVPSMGIPCRLVRATDDRVEYEVAGTIVSIDVDEVIAVGMVPRDIAEFFYNRLSLPEPIVVTAPLAPATADG